ncbi:radical SAM protein [Amycolatopsis rhizosphaerae]|uniref:Radical SAM protein n=1 Tax=Amycolatopsis rhizosphaerae TaxID=2053003 RepID=A0A558C5I2_9PSEU|nr:Rv2578c family radical SAM protein [Amycolatopsis rhizosphaerae]TVT44051.1 radical SAM protein [Amycolatopsis rhizosphaerae]
MRWESQRAGAEAQQALIGLDGLVRSVPAPEFAGLTFHEVRARSVLNRVPGRSRVPFRWTVNPYRGCSHACTYCFARNTHTYLDFDAGRDFDTQVVVKINAPEVLAAQLRRPGWTREHVAMGTNTDPYQRAEGRYRLMPGIIRAFAGSGTPFSVLTKGTTLARDLPLLRSVSVEVDVGLGVSIALLDRALQHRLEPGTPSPKARLELVRRIRDAGLDCSVMVAPVLPGLTDSTGQLDELLAAIAAAGATGATVLALHLRPGTREWYGRWLAREYPELVPRYRELYAGGSYAGGRYRRTLAARVAPLLRRHGLGGHTGSAHRPSAEPSAGAGAAVPVPPPAAGQLTLL